MFQDPKGHVAKICEVYLQCSMDGNSTTKWPFYTNFSSKCHSNIYSILFDFRSLIYNLKDDILLNKEWTNHYENKKIISSVHFENLSVFIGKSLDMLQYSEEYLLRCVFSFKPGNTLFEKCIKFNNFFFVNLSINFAFLLNSCLRKL